VNLNSLTQTELRSCLESIKAGFSVVKNRKNLAEHLVIWTILLTMQDSYRGLATALHGHRKLIKTMSSMVNCSRPVVIDHRASGRIQSGA
jgi:hypothetical protein